MGDIKFISQLPPTLLTPFLESFSYFENEKGIPHHYTILPDGLCDIVLFFNKSNVLLDTQFYGIWNKEIHVQVPANNNVLVVSMYPIASEYLLKFPIANFLNAYKSVTDFNHLIQPNLPYTFHEAVDQFTTYFTNQLQSIDTRKTSLFQLIQQTNGEMSIKEMEKKVFWSQRQMNRYFTEWFGLSLKAYLNIIRCAKTYTQVKQGDFYPSLSFTDQSHFTKELKKHTGNTPRQLYLKYHASIQHSSVL